MKLRLLFTLFQLKHRFRKGQPQLLYLQLSPRILYNKIISVILLHITQHSHVKKKFLKRNAFK